MKCKKCGGPTVKIEGEGLVCLRCGCKMTSTGELK